MKIPLSIQDSGNLNVAGRPSALGDLYDVSAPRDSRTSVRTGSFDQKTSACGLFFSASSLFARPVLLAYSVS
jgi:hypothetical protein